MSCRLPPVPPNFQRYGSVSLFLILMFDFFRPFEGANQTKKNNNIVIGGAGGYWITRGWIIRPSMVVLDLFEQRTI